MAVTSQLRPSASFGEVMVQDWQAAGLLKPSAIKPVITTIERSLVIRAMGKLAQADVAALRRSIASISG
jgi:mRNA interferase MazF